MAWRTGRKVGRTIYRVIGDEPSDHDPLIGVMDTREYAAQAVTAINEGDSLPALVVQLRHENEQLHHTKPHYVSSQSTSQDPVGHDGWECDGRCDACYFAREASKLRAKIKELVAVLEEFADPGNWDIEGDPMGAFEWDGGTDPIRQALNALRN